MVHLESRPEGAAQGLLGSSSVLTFPADSTRDVFERADVEASLQGTLDAVGIGRYDVAQARSTFANTGARGLQMKILCSGIDKQRVAIDGRCV